MFIQFLQVTSTMMKFTIFVIASVLTTGLNAASYGTFPNFVLPENVPVVGRPLPETVLPEVEAVVPELITVNPCDACFSYMTSLIDQLTVVARPEPVVPELPEVVLPEVPELPEVVLPEVPETGVPAPEVPSIPEIELPEVEIVRPLPETVPEDLRPLPVPEQPEIEINPIPVPVIPETEVRPLPLPVVPEVEVNPIPAPVQPQVRPEISNIIPLPFYFNN